MKPSALNNGNKAKSFVVNLTANERRDHEFYKQRIASILARKGYLNITTERPQPDNGGGSAEPDVRAQFWDEKATRPNGKKPRERILYTIVVEVETRPTPASIKRKRAQYRADHTLVYIVSIPKVNRLLKERRAWKTTSVDKFLKSLDSILSEMVGVGA